MYEAQAWIESFEESRIVNANGGDPGLMGIPGLKIIRMVIGLIAGDADIKHRIGWVCCRLSLESVEHNPPLPAGDPDRQRTGRGDVILSVGRA